MKKILCWAAAILAAVLAAAYFAIPHVMFNFMLGTPERSTAVPDSYKESPHYTASISGRELMSEIGSEDHYIQSRDGLKLHSYVFRAEEESKKFVIGVHGYKSYSRPEYAPYIEFYRSLGYNMLLPDDRAHAPSEGDYIGFGVLDRLDVVDWAKYIVETYGEDVEILLHGVSMGAASVVSASAEEDLPVQVKGVVSDCGFSDPYAELVVLMKDVGKLPLVDWVMPKMEKLAEKKAGYNFHDITAEKQVVNAKVPILFVHGDQDLIVPPYMAQNLYEACGSEKRLLMVEGAGHGESIAYAPEEYYAAIREHFGI